MSLKNTTHLLASSILASAIALPAYAAAATAETESNEVIIVTGSRIARPDLQASTPIQVVSATNLAEQGAVNVSDVLNELPAVGIGTTRTNSNFATSGNGQATVNLRNLGSNRTLVLQNGRRLVSGIGGSSAVDLNNIPTELIERVEVLTGGASALYGSEAMAGVVNFILKKNYQGVALRTQAGITSKGDLPTRLFAATAGTNFNDGRGNITVYGQYDKDGGLLSRKRKISAEDNPFRSSFVPQGRFDVIDPNGDDIQDLSTVYTYGPDNQLKEGYVGAVDGYNRNAQRYISVPVERYMGSILAHYDFADEIGVFFEGNYAKTKSRSRLEALATDNSDATMPDGTPYGGLTIDNPFIPDIIKAKMTELGTDTLLFRKRMVGVFDRSNVNEREYYRVVAGFQGEIAGKWNWDAYYNYGQTTESTASETALRDRYYYALDAIAGPGGTAICRDAAARAAGCVPFNPFGFNSASPQAAAYITNNGQLSTYDSKVSQSVFGANLSGPIYTLPAGDVKIAVGAERRTEKSREVFDLQTQLGNTMGNALTNTIGKYKVFESYAETVIPLIADQPWAEYLGVEGAVRYGDYSTVGTVWSWKGGAEYAPSRDIRFRAVYSVATRAPNIGELYQGASQTFPNGIVDPCEGVTLTSNRPQDVYCRAVPGIASQIAGGGAFTYDDNTDVQSIEGTDGGNLNLSEETAKTLTLGVVFTPQSIRNFSMTVDFFDIRVRDAIQFVPRNSILQTCVDMAGASPLCELIVREGAGGNPRGRTPGTVWQIDSRPVNAASIQTRGIDVAVRYKTPEFQMFKATSAISFNLAYTYLDKLTLQPLAGLPVENNRGQLDGDGRLGAGFKHRWNLSTTLDMGDVSLNWRANFLSKMKDTLGPDVDSPLGDETNTVKSYFYNDAQLRWNFGGDTNRTLELYFGIDNMFDVKPPVINQNGASHITGTETAADTYDPYGRRFYAGAAIKF
ncbi:TonB-dependent receptor domain-containing protein [Aquisediminimonas sediminicola]|uniref:TonB-dependent receptor domain-containing protein n=1 Tax=Alteraquisediminimonas sediminicola TaxID=2676787 RepID=UPI001C8EC30E|nr:TonB-dependent receptor [Aquisediminimonas sediminicola]